MNVQLLLKVLRFRWKLGFGVWTGTLLAIVLATCVGAWQYSASTMVLVEPKAQDGGAASAAIGTGHIPTEMEVIRSERVALRAIRSLSPVEQTGWRELWEKRTGALGNFEVWLSDRLLSRLEIRPAREANVLTIAYTSGDPGRAARLANAFTQAYLDVSEELRREPAREYSAYFAETAARLRANLEAAQAKRAKFQRDNGLVSSSASLDTEMMHLAELNSQVVVLEATSAAAASRQRQSGSAGGLGEVERDPLVSSLRAELSRQQTRLAELRTRMGDEHPVVIELRDGTAELQARVQAAVRRAAGTVATEDRVAGERLVRARAALSQQRAKVLAITSLRDEQGVLDREVEGAQRAFDLALTRFSQTSMESGGSRRNVSVLKQATSPLLPSWPNVPVVLVGGALVGLVVAVFAMLLRERTDMRLRTASAKSSLGLRVVALLEDTATIAPRQARIPAA